MTEPAVYLLNFERRFYGANNGHPVGVQPYVGVALDGDAERRLAQHLSGAGSTLVAAVHQAGIAVHLVLVMSGDRALERRLKKHHGHARHQSEY